MVVWVRAQPMHAGARTLRMSSSDRFSKSSSSSSYIDVVDLVSESFCSRSPLLEDWVLPENGAEVAAVSGDPEA